MSGPRWECPCGHKLTWEPDAGPPPEGAGCDAPDCVCAQCAGKEPTGFTLGHEESYDEYLRRDGPTFKTGRCVLEDGEEYGGGWLWREASHAEEFRTDARLGEFAVYALRLPGPWEECAGQPGSDGVARLLKDAEIIGKVPM